MKQTVKRLLPPGLQIVAGRYLDALEMVTLSVCLWAPIHRLRLGALRAWGATVSPEAVIYHAAQVRAARNLTIAARANIGDHAVLDARGGITIDEDANLSSGVQIWTGQHQRDSPDFAYEQAPVTVGRRAWIGPRVILLPGTTIEEGAVVAAGAVVKGRVEAFTMVGGVPARLIGRREHNLTYRLPTPRGKTPWW